MKVWCLQHINEYGHCTFMGIFTTKGAALVAKQHHLESCPTLDSTNFDIWEEVVLEENQIHSYSTNSGTQ